MTNGAAGAGGREREPSAPRAARATARYPEVRCRGGPWLARVVAAVVLRRMRRAMGRLVMAVTGLRPVRLGGRSCGLGGLTAFGAFRAGRWAASARRARPAIDAVRPGRRGDDPAPLRTSAGRSALPARPGRDRSRGRSVGWATAADDAAVTGPAVVGAAVGASGRLGGRCRSGCRAWASASVSAWVWRSGRRHRAACPAAARWPAASGSGRASGSGTGRRGAGRTRVG